MNVIIALTVVCVVIFTITANMTVTFFVFLCVALVDLFLFSLMGYWDIPLNSISVINIIIAIGLAVDYSAHIGHAYMMVSAPEKHQDGRDLTVYEQRKFKVSVALGSMGSSVFHGAFSTFLAIVCLSPSQSYVFETFFKMWFGIIVFGVANGFVLLPVMLTLCGPLNKVDHKEFEND